MLIVGLMSGTSADGVDAALCRIEGRPPRLRAAILHGITAPYDDRLRQAILDACTPEEGRVDRLCRLGFELAERFAEAVLAVAGEAGVALDDVDLIASHGQTVWHQIDEGRAVATLQLGQAGVVAERTGVTTVSNFRPRDIAAGGQGAPLTGYADWLLLRHPERRRAVQNIGGIANVTFLPPLADADGAPLAFDTGPGNALIDAAVALLSGGAARYDRDGAMAARSRPDEGWLAELLRHPYYRRRPPKTTGRELFGAGMAADLVAEGRRQGLSPEAIVATLTALTAASIARAYADFAPAPVAEAIVGGGGARNRALMAMLRQRLPGVSVLSHEDVGISSDHKEALAFALLAHETWHGRPGTLPALTGARHPSVLGEITPGANYERLLRRTWATA